MNCKRWIVHRECEKQKAELSHNALPAHMAWGDSGIARKTSCNYLIQAKTQAHD